MLIEASHPASVVYVPKGARKTRHAFVATRTPVRIEHVPSEATRFVHTLEGPSPSRPGNVDLHEHGGVLWKRLTAQTGNLDRPRRPLSPREWASFVTGSMRADEPTLPFLQREFARTPLVAIPPVPTPTSWDPLAHRTQGVAFGEADHRRLDADGREEASKALAAWMAGEIRLTDGGVLARYRPLAGFHGRFSGLSYVDEPRWEPPGRPPCRPSDHEAYLRLWEFGSEPDELLTDQFRQAHATLSAFPDEDEDLRLLANDLPSLALGYLGEQRAGTAVTVGSERHERTTSFVASLVGLSLRSATGSVTVNEARDVLREVRAAIRFSNDEFLTHPKGATWIRLGRHLDMVTARRPPVVDEGDVMAMEGLGMGATR